MKPQWLSRSTMFLALGLATACAAYTQSATRESEAIETAAGLRRGTSGTLARGDFASYEGQPLSEALAHLRPDWLRLNPSARAGGEGERAVLYVDDVATGDLGGLQMIPSGRVSEVRLLSPAEAWARFGALCRCPAGAILVRTRTNE